MFQEAEERIDQVPALILPEALDRLTPDVWLRISKRDEKDRVEVEFDIVFGKLDKVAYEAATASGV
jgi:hypothetical protein